MRCYGGSFYLGVGTRIATTYNSSWSREFDLILFAIALNCPDYDYTESMKQPEYIEGPQALENFEEGMKALFKVSKAEVVKAEKRERKKRTSRAEIVRKPKASDKD